MPWKHLFHSSLDITPDQPLDPLFPNVPAKRAVYLLAGPDAKPLQLLCVANLRASLIHRLGQTPPAGTSKRLDYRQVVHSVHWHQVDSAFEADWLYLEAARLIFPQTYQGMIGFRPAWFIHIDPDAPFPRYTKTIDLSPSPGIFLGPLEDKHAAARLMQLAEDQYDLCRYYNILLESPNGKACAYKEMGKCPAPCDGSISLSEYRDLVRQSAQALQDPSMAAARTTQLMRALAGELKFEAAAKLKSRLDSLAQLGKGPFRFVRPLDDFSYLSVQRGPWANTAKLFLIVRGQIEAAACITRDAADRPDLLRYLLARAHVLGRPELSPEGIERIGLVSNQLFSARASHGVFIPLAHLTESSLSKAILSLKKQKVAEQTNDEGVTRELQALDGPP